MSVQYDYFYKTITPWQTETENYCFQIYILYNTFVWKREGLKLRSVWDCDLLHFKGILPGDKAILWIGKVRDHQNRQREKGRDLTQSYNKSPYTNNMSLGLSDNTNNSTKRFHYTAVADRLRAVSWSNYGNPTGVVNLVYGPTFPLPATAV